LRANAGIKGPLALLNLVESMNLTFEQEFAAGGLKCQIRSTGLRGAVRTIVHPLRFGTG
jgi:hypothetical protein